MQLLLTQQSACHGPVTAPGPVPLGGEARTGQSPWLYRSRAQVCEDLGVPREAFERVYRKGVLPRPKIRILKRGCHLYDQRQFDWLERFFGLLRRPVEGLPSRRSYTPIQIIEILQVTDEEFDHMWRLDFVTQPEWSSERKALCYSYDQLNWLVDYFDLQESKDYDPTVNYLPSDKAHLRLGLGREKYLRFLEENPVSRPVVSLIDMSGYYYHNDHLEAIRRSLMFGRVLAAA